jgi:hypothetical protein
MDATSRANPSLRSIMAEVRAASAAAAQLRRDRDNARRRERRALQRDVDFLTERRAQLLRLEETWYDRLPWSRASLVERRERIEGRIRGLTRPCEDCRALIVGRRADRRYCSNRCRQRAYRQRRAALHNGGAAAAPPRRGSSSR